jgi:iron complex transport system permease protein
MNVKIRCVALFIAGTLLILIGMFAGPANVSIQEVLNALSRSGDAALSTIIWDMRIPRVLVSMLTGACLGLAGVLIQLSTRSPLGDPNLFGIGGGAAIFLAAVAAGVVAMANFGVFAGSVLSSLLVAAFLSFLISKENIGPIKIAIIGLAVGALTISIGTSVISHGRVFPTQIIGLVAGSFTSSNWVTVYYLSSTLALCMVGSVIIAKRFYPIILGDVLSKSLGVSPIKTRSLSMGMAAALSGASVYAGGVIGFVGLLSPHLARWIFGNSPRNLIIGSVWIGALATMLADQLARLLFAPVELPVGMVTTLMGAPMMIYLALKIK